MNPRFLQTFLRVALCRNVTRAASELHLAQSSVSDQIQALEDELGTTLFLRSRQGLQPTLAGEALIAHAQEILAALDSARAAVAFASRSIERSIAIGALETIATETLPPPLTSLWRDHPELRVRIEVAGSADLMQRLHDGRIDVAFCFRRDALDDKFIRRIYATEPMVMIGPPTASGAPTLPEWRTLGTVSFVVTEPGCVYRHLFDQAWQRAGAAPPIPTAEVGSIGAIVRLVAAGIGFALLPRLAVKRELECGAVMQYRWTGSEIDATLDMVWRRRRVKLPGLELFLSLIGDAQRSLKQGGDRLQHAEPIPS